MGQVVLTAIRPASVGLWSAGRVAFMATLCVLLLAAPLSATTIAVDFEIAVDNSPIYLTFAGLGIEFDGAVAKDAASGLNTSLMPPVSGTKVAAPDGSGFTVRFASPVRSFNTYISFLSPVMLTAYDANNNVITSFTTPTNCQANAPNCGNPNLLISLYSQSGISRIVFDQPAGLGDFVIDDVTFDTFATAPTSFDNIVITPTDTAIPEPSTAWLAALALFALPFARRR